MTLLPRRPLRIAGLLAALLLPLGLALPAAAALTAEDQAEVRAYELTTDYLAQVEALTEDARAQGVRASLEPEDFREAENLDALAARLDAKPGVHALLAEHDLSAREYLVGALALFGAALVARYGDDPEKAAAIDESKVNPEQVAFYEAHRERIEALMQLPERQ